MVYSKYGNLVSDYGVFSYQFAQIACCNGHIEYAGDPKDPTLYCIHLGTKRSGVVDVVEAASTPGPMHILNVAHVNTSIVTMFRSTAPFSNDGHRSGMADF